jgi:hypothetical protein
MERRILWKKRVNEYFSGGFIKRCRLSWLTNSDLLYEHKCRGGVAGSQSMSTAVHTELK